MSATLEECLQAGAYDMGIELDSERLAAFRRYYEILMEENDKYNLTSIKVEAEVAVKHFLDCLYCVKFLDLRGGYLIDVGTGAGFPGVPLKIYCPEMDLLLVDSVRKKVNFLLLLVEKLGLEGVSARWDRAETMGRNSHFREKAGVVVSRAVAPLNVLSELCLPLVKTGGCFLSMKGPGAEEELESAQRAVDILGGAVERLERFKLPLSGDERAIVLIKKVKPTPAGYPRREGIPAKRPI
ncbi:MAG: 16S rRNA (guanine(527)-N(7))-methyltransferase RsmG [Bacillota bacterium]